VFLGSAILVLVTANVVPRALIHFTLMMEAILFSETSVLTRSTLRHVQNDGIFFLLCFMICNIDRMNIA
jgi:hypothetical protein